MTSAAIGLDQHWFSFGSGPRLHFRFHRVCYEKPKSRESHGWPIPFTYDSCCSCPYLFFRPSTVRLVSNRGTWSSGPRVRPLELKVRGNVRPTSNGLRILHQRDAVDTSSIPRNFSLTPTQIGLVLNIHRTAEHFSYQCEQA